MLWRRLIYTSVLAVAVCACLSLEAVSVTWVGRRPRPGQDHHTHAVAGNPREDDV